MAVSNSLFYALISLCLWIHQINGVRSKARQPALELLCISFYIITPWMIGALHAQPACDIHGMP